LAIYGGVLAIYGGLDVAHGPGLARRRESPAPVAVRAEPRSLRHDVEVAFRAAEGLLGDPGRLRRFENTVRRDRART
jgi:hypothetical protein